MYSYEERVRAVRRPKRSGLRRSARDAAKLGSAPEGCGIGSQYCCCPSVKFSTIFSRLHGWLECCPPSVFDFGRCRPSSAASGTRVDPKGLFSTLFGQNMWS